MIMQMKHYKELYGTYETLMHMHLGTGPSTDDKSLSANKSSSGNYHTMDFVKGTVTTINWSTDDCQGDETENDSNDD